MDFEANYRTQLPGRPLTVRALITYQPHIVLVQPAAVNIETAGIREPMWRATAYFRYSATEAFTIDVLTRWRSDAAERRPGLFVFRSDADRIVNSASFTNITLPIASRARAWGRSTRS